jgi:anthranilate phosphoribosyltransferase
MVCLNAGAAFYCAGIEPSISGGYKRSRDLIETGKVQELFKKYKELSTP